MLELWTSFLHTSPGAQTVTSLKMQTSQTYPSSKEALYFLSFLSHVQLLSCPFTFLPLPISHKVWLMKPWNFLHFQLSQCCWFKISCLPLQVHLMASKVTQLPNVTSFYFHFSSLSFRSFQHNPF